MKFKKNQKTNFPKNELKQDCVQASADGDENRWEETDLLKEKESRDVRDT